MEEVKSKKEEINQLASDCDFCPKHPNQEDCFCRTFRDTKMCGKKLVAVEGYCYQYNNLEPLEETRYLVLYDDVPQFPMVAISKTYNCRQGCYSYSEIKQVISRFGNGLAVFYVSGGEHQDFDLGTVCKIVSWHNGGGNHGFGPAGIYVELEFNTEWGVITAVACPILLGPDD